MCYAFPYTKRVQLTVGANPELVTNWYSTRPFMHSVDTIRMLKLIKAVTPRVVDWLEATGFDFECRASMHGCHLSVIFDDETECKLFKMAFDL
jgi:hypothetical protein